MMKPIKGRFGCFTDTIVVPIQYKEVEPRKFVTEITIGPLREEDLYDTIIIPSGKRAKAYRMWWRTKIGRIVSRAGEWIYLYGQKLQALRMEEIFGDDRREHR